MAVILSCIMPVHNAAPYLEQAVESILSQSWPYFELLLIEDGSTDGSDRLCDELSRKDARIRVIHQTNQGVAAARNEGLRCAEGRILCFVDADDKLRPGAFARIIPAFENRGRDLVSFGFSYCSEAEDRPVVYPSFACEQPQDFWPHFLDYFKAGLFYSLCNKAYRADLIRQHGLSFNPNLRTGEDIAFNCEYFSVARSIEHLETSYYEYWSHPVSLTRRATLDNMEICSQTLHILKGFLHRNGRDDLYPPLAADQISVYASGFYALLTDSSKPYTMQQRRENLQKLFCNELWHAALLSALADCTSRYDRFLRFAARRKSIFLATLPARLKSR